ncbi:MAG: DUF4270 domain-containing protein [Chitinophagales bacterium]|jgi:hypothetical protein
MNKAVFLLIGGLIVLTASCRKDNFIGEELLPEEDFLNSARIDTFTMITYTDIDDSIVTSQNPFYALGSMQSDIYGKSTAGIFAQLLLPANNLFFGDNATVDSVVLTLDYASYYGDTTATHCVSVYRMSEPLFNNRNYYSNQKFHYLPIPIGKKNEFKANNRDSVVLADGSEWEPHLRINLFDAFGQNIINLDSTVLESDTAFLQYLQGLYISADTLTDGYSRGLMYFDMASDITGVRIYYKNSEADSLSVLFPFDGVKTNYFKNTYPESSQAYNAIINPDTTNGEAFTYVKGFTALRTIVKLPTLTNLKDVSVNKAELIFTTTTDDGRFFNAPPKLILLPQDSTGHNSYYFALYSEEYFSSIVDDNFGGTDIGGTIVETVSEETGRTVYQYKFIITRHIQEMLEGSIDNYGFALSCIPGNRIPNAVTLGGVNSPRANFKPYLSITYTTINK